MQLCSLRDAASDFERLDAHVVAISVDTPEAAREFAQQQGFRFPVLADPGHRVADLYGVTREGLARRISFILDPQGVIRHVDDSVRISHHGADLVAVLETLRAK